MDDLMIKQYLSFKNWTIDDIGLGRPRDNKIFIQESLTRLSI